MGDNGSLLLGFNIGAISIVVSMKAGAALSVVIPILFVAIPVLDTFFAIFRRLANGQNPLTHADRGHIHHKLLDLNLSNKQTLIVFYLLSFLLSALAISALHVGIILTLIIVLLICYTLLLVL